MSRSTAGYTSTWANERSAPFASWATDPEATFKQGQRLNLSDATIDLTAVDCARLLSDWSWLVEGQYSPLLMTAFGDLFLQSDDGHVWFLDLVSGEFNDVARCRDDWAEMFNEAQTVEEWLMPGLVEALLEQGMSLAEGSCYGYRIPPVLGGKIEIENIEQTDLSVYYSITGQIHRQVKDLPPGTPISGITVDGLKP